MKSWNVTVPVGVGPGFGFAAVAVKVTDWPVTQVRTSGTVELRVRLRPLAGPRAKRVPPLRV